MKKLLHNLPKGFTVPDLPERMIWTGSAIKAFRACPRLFFWKYATRLAPKVKSAPLVIGTAFHDAIGTWYKFPRSLMPMIAARVAGEVREEFKKSAALYNTEDAEALQTALTTFQGMLMGYARIYEHDRKVWRFTPEDIERQFTVDMGDFDFQGSIDLIAREPGKRVLIENKTASNIDESYVDRLALDTQTRGYLFGATKACGLKIDRVIYNVTRKCKLRRRGGEKLDDFNERIALDYAARPDFYFYRETLPLTPGCIEAFELEIRQTHAAFQAMRDRMTNIGDPREWYINDQHCTAYHRTCEFHRLCVDGLDSGNGTLFEQSPTLHRELIV